MKPVRVEVDYSTPALPRYQVGRHGKATKVVMRHPVHAVALGFRRDAALDKSDKEYRFRALVEVSPAHRSFVPIDAWISRNLAWVPALYALNMTQTAEFRESGEYQVLADLT